MIKQFIPISLLTVSALFGTRAAAQDQFRKDFESVHQELVSWDPVRGEWLSSSLVAMANNQPIPDRMFPEDFTPMEMLKVVPAATRTRIATTAQTQSTNTRDSLSRHSWNQVSSVLGRTSCQPVMARTYGDPHLSSFDGATYAFQTVGEFVMAKSRSGNFEVQARQRAQTEDFSLNTAVAMNVAGDRVCLYAQEKPDGNNTTPVRLNGEAIYVDDQAYFLPHGGTIHRSNRTNYLITWPTGETASIDMNGAGTNFPFMNIALQIYPCSDSYDGVLGNANGRSSDDFDIRNNGGASMPVNMSFPPMASSNNQASQEMQKEYLAYLAKDFARSWRVQQPTSLFDYGFGMNTLSYTDERFPMVHHTIGDLSQDQRNRAERDCRRNGISAADMNGCIYDRGFVNIPPSPRPVVPDRTVAYNPKPVTNPVPNVNPGGTRKPTLGAAAPSKVPDGTTSTTGGVPTVGASSPGKEPTGSSNGAQTLDTHPGTTTTTGKSPEVISQPTTTTASKTPESVSQPATTSGVEKPVITTTTVEHKQPTTTSQPVEQEESGSKAGRFLGTVFGTGTTGTSSGNNGSSGSSGTISIPHTSTSAPTRTSTPAPTHTTTPAPVIRTTTPTPAPSRGGRF